jgi:hypothetical protein
MVSYISLQHDSIGADKMPCAAPFWKGGIRTRRTAITTNIHSLQFWYDWTTRRSPSGLSGSPLRADCLGADLGLTGVTCMSMCLRCGHETLLAACLFSNITKLSRPFAFVLFFLNSQSKALVLTQDAAKTRVQDLNT